MNRQRKQKIRDIQSDDELSESGPEISDAEDYAEGMILFQQLSLTIVRTDPNHVYDFKKMNFSPYINTERNSFFLES